MSASTLSFESNLLDVTTAVVMFPIAIVRGLLWLVWQACTLLWPYRRYIAITLVAAAFVGVCVVCPMLPLGLAITAAFAYATKPRGRK